VKPSISGCRTELGHALERQAAPRVLVDLEEPGLSAFALDLDGHELRSEGARVDALDRASVAVDRPLVHVRA
jgi:hypothetical protein